jgi:hypothetical protein
VKTLISGFLISFSAQAALVPEAFLDTYFAYDTNRPREKNRPYTTQSVRHNEPNINLAFAGVRLDADSYRGRFIIQTGNSVEANTPYESDDLKYIQEAVIGKRIGEKTWLDGGISLGHLGAESWISRENWTYTRSLNLDYVPYYATGLRLSHMIDEKRSIQMHLMNGWQNIREDNKAKAVGFQFVNQCREGLTITYNNFLGDEEVTPSEKTGKFRPRFRGYHNLILKWDTPGEWQYLYAVDLAHESQKENDGIHLMWATTLTSRLAINETQAIASRIEYYNDSHQINVITPRGENFEVMSASVNFDQKIGAQINWRSEIRGYTSKEDIFPQGNDRPRHQNGVLITSLSLSLP